MNQKQFKLFVLTLLLITCFCELLGSRDRFGGSFMLLLSIYSLARYLSIYDIKIKQAWLWYIATLVMSISSYYFCYSMSKPLLIDYVICYNSILTIMGSVFLFYTFKNFKTNICNKTINKIATSTFALYLITESRLGKHLLYDREWFSFLSADSYFMKTIQILAVAIIALIITIIIDSIRKNSFKNIFLFYDKLSHRIHN